MKKMIFAAVVVGTVFGICPAALPQISAQTAQANKSQSKTKKPPVASAKSVGAVQGRIIALPAETAGQYVIINFEKSDATTPHPPSPKSHPLPCGEQSGATGPHGPNPCGDVRFPIKLLKRKGITSIENLMFIPNFQVSYFNLEVHSPNGAQLYQSEPFKAAAGHASRSIFKLDEAGVRAVTQNFNSDNFIIIRVTLPTEVKSPQISVALKAEQ